MGRSSVSGDAGIGFQASSEAGVNTGAAAQPYSQEMGGNAPEQGSTRTVMPVLQQLKARLQASRQGAASLGASPISPAPQAVPASFSASASAAVSASVSASPAPMVAPPSRSAGVAVSTVLRGNPVGSRPAQPISTSSAAPALAVSPGVGAASSVAAPARAPTPVPAMPRPSAAWAAQFAQQVTQASQDSQRPERGAVDAEAIAVRGSVRGAAVQPVVEASIQIRLTNASASNAANAASKPSKPSKTSRVKPLADGESEGKSKPAKASKASKSTKDSSKASKADSDSPGSSASSSAGPNRNSAAVKLKLSDNRHALLCAPDSYVDLRQIHRELPDVDSDEAAEMRLYVLRVSRIAGFDAQKRAIELRHNGDWARCRRLEITLKDEQGDTASLSVFGAIWSYRDCVIGDDVPIIGRIERAYGRVQVTDAVNPPAHAIGKIWVRYAGISGQVSGESVTALVRSQMDDPDAYRFCAAYITGELGLRPSEALKTLGCDDVFENFEDLLRNLHQPTEPDKGWLALCAAHKIASMGIQAAALRHNVRHPHRQSPLPVSAESMMSLASTQKETLTADQIEVTKGILSRLADPTPLNGLLSGDVGTGKTLAYLLPAVEAHRVGAKVAIIAPTMILADQITQQIAMRFGSLGCSVERIEAGGKIKNSSAIIVGTSGLVNVAARRGYEPNLLIFDEQHKLSTTVRESLVKPWTHVLEVSATPIPRSIASAMFGGRDVFNLRGCPVEKTFDNHIADLSERATFTAMMRQALADGGKVAVVYPRVQESAQSQSLDDDARQVQQAMASLGRVDQAAKAGVASSASAASVIEGAKALEAAFPGMVAAVHGGMADTEIALAISQLRSGEKRIIVASTVIETGVDIPSLKMMIVRDAHCFGISQLHQLRGRLVRNGGVGQFVMMVPSMETISPETFARLEAVREVNDGYLLAERDLAVRGFGELAGVNQSGKSETVFKLLKMEAVDHLNDPDFATMAGKMIARSKLAMSMQGSSAGSSQPSPVATSGVDESGDAQEGDAHPMRQRALFG